MVQLSCPYMTTGKTIALTRRTFIDKVMSLLFNMLFRLVRASLPGGKCLLISWLQSPSAVIFEPKKIKSVTVSTVFSSICHEVMGPDSMILVFWLLSFKPSFSLSSFTFIKRLFSYSLLSAIRVVSSAYLRLLIFLLAILIPACALSSLAFLMMYSEVAGLIERWNGYWRLHWKCPEKVGSLKGCGVCFESRTIIRCWLPCSQDTWVQGTRGGGGGWLLSLLHLVSHSQRFCSLS